MEAVFLFLCKALSTATLLFQGIVGLSLIVVFHEFGHLLCAKLFNVYAPSFSIGFGPKLFEIQLGETAYTLRALPLGGFVEIAGSPEPGQGEQTHAHARDDRSLASKPYWQKMLILLTGIIFNGVFAFLALSLLSYIGMPCLSSDLCHDQEPIVFTALPDSQAAQNGLKPYDKIIAINGRAVSTVQAISTALQEHSEPIATLRVQRREHLGKAAQSTEHTIQLKTTISSNKGEKQAQATRLEQLGITWYLQPTSFIEALVSGKRMTVRMIRVIASAFANIFKTPERIGGPLMIIVHTAQCAKRGLRTFLFILALLSINLGVLNLLPIPPLDGFQALLYTLEAVTGRELSFNVREFIGRVTFYALILFIIFMTYRDAIRIGRTFFGTKKPALIEAK